MNKQQYPLPGDNDGEISSGFEYEAQLQSSQLNGAVKVAIDKDALLLSSLFNRISIEYTDITSFSISENALHIDTPESSFTLNQMGDKCDRCYQDLYNTYNRKVLKAFFAQGDALLETSGNYQINENGKCLQGTGRFLLYKDCLCILPPSNHARRIPLSFIGDLDRDQYTLNITMVCGDSYNLSRMGYDTDIFEKQLTDCILSQQKKWLSFIRSLDASISTSDSIKIAELMPPDRTVAFILLKANYPSLVAKIEERIKQSRIADAFDTIQDIIDSQHLLISIKAAPEAQTPYPDISDPANKYQDNSIQPEQSMATIPEYTIWLIAPSKDHSRAIVEMALPGDQAAATYLFRTDGNFQQLADYINRSLEAVSFRREFIILPDDELQGEKYSGYRMLLERTPVINVIRQRYIKRIIHTSPAKWKKDVMSDLMISVDNTGRLQGTKVMQICPTCGSSLQENAKYCANCGAKII